MNIDIANFFRMPTEICKINSLPSNDYREDGISPQYTHLNICQYYDRFKMSFDEYSNANWVPEKKEYVLNFGVHYTCHKKDRATFESLLNFRIYYPNIPIVLISDNGHDFSEMAKYFNCIYIHEQNQAGNGITNALCDDQKIHLWLERLKRTCDMLPDVDYILYMEDDVLTRDKITKNPNADLAGPSNPKDFWWSPQIINWLKQNYPDIEINGLNGCGGTIFKRQSFLECLQNIPDYKMLGELDDRLTWASDVILTFLFLYNKKISRKWLDHSEESHGKIFGSTAFDHQYKYFYDKKWSQCYLKNIDLDKADNFIFTACSDQIFEDQMIPFIASLRENTKFNGTLVVIDYGLSESRLELLINNNIRIIPGIGKYEIIIDRFMSIYRYIHLLNDPKKIFIHYDCDIWFNKDISDIFEICRSTGKVLCTKDVWHCGFLHDCVSQEEHKEYNRNILFEVEQMCGKILQAGFICGNLYFWKTYTGYLTKLLSNKYLQNSFGADELVLNLLYYYMRDMFLIISIGYNTLPQWGIKEIEGNLFATDFHTDSKLNTIKGHTEEVFAVHLSSAARNREEFNHIDYKIKHKTMYENYYNKFKPLDNLITKKESLIRFGYRHLFPVLLDETNSKIICEVGVQWGNNLFNMVNNSNVQEAWGIDIWKNTGILSENDIGLSQEEEDIIYEHVIRVANNSNNRIKIIRDFSYNAVQLFADQYFDFIYIDGDHSYDGCLRDIENWWPKIKIGGILAGDDYVEAISPIGVTFGVITAVQRFVSRHNLEENFVHTYGKDNKGSSPQWFILKK